MPWQVWSFTGFIVRDMKLKAKKKKWYHWIKKYRSAWVWLEFINARSDSQALLLPLWNKWIHAECALCAQPVPVSSSRLLPGPKFGCSIKAGETWEGICINLVLLMCPVSSTVCWSFEMRHIIMENVANVYIYIVLFVCLFFQTMCTLVKSYPLAWHEV